MIQQSESQQTKVPFLAGFPLLEGLQSIDYRWGLFEARGRPQPLDQLRVGTRNPTPGILETTSRASFNTVFEVLPGWSQSASSISSVAGGQVDSMHVRRPMRARGARPAFRRAPPTPRKVSRVRPRELYKLDQEVI